jgi:hypothetical protein
MKGDFVTAALPYVEKLRWSVFLLAPLGKEPFVPKRHGGNGVHDATRDPEQIRAWGRMCPHGNIGIACGEASGIVVLDVDPRNGGDATIRALAVKHSFPRTPRARTGNGGWHLFFRYQPGIRGSARKLGPGVEVKSTGGYIVAPPSFTGPSDAGRGGLYVWEVSPFEVPPPPLPAWLVEMLLPPPKRTSPSFTSDAHGGDFEGAARFLERTPSGNRHHVLYWATCCAGEVVDSRAISEQDAIRRLTEAATAAGMTGADEVIEVRRTIQDGLKRGRENGGKP